MVPITVGNYRQEEGGPMQVVSEPMGKEKVHFEAPAAHKVRAEMNQFLNWFNTETKLDPVFKAAIAHFWFITIHPMDDGNGRMARAITDLMLARADETNQRFYSMSAQIELDKNLYYHKLEKMQKGDLDLTGWLNWFFTCLGKALNATDETPDKVFAKARYWELHKQTPINPRQQKVINRLFGDLFGKLSTSKWAKICKVSQDTANRDINDLMAKGMLEKEPGGGRSTSYVLTIYNEK